jgi:hypothetical protein
MLLETIRYYVLNCGILLIPVIAWNLLFTKKLPHTFTLAEFWRDIPAPLAATENGLRILAFVLPFLMPLTLDNLRQRFGMALFFIGTVVYFASWLPLLISPSSRWSRSFWGFLAPAYTPVVWLIGLAMLGQSLYFGNFYRWWMYLCISLGFLAAHITHTSIIYKRSHSKRH